MEEHPSDHDLLIRTNQLVTIHVAECSERKRDWEKRLRWMERLMYTGLGGLALLQALHLFGFGGVK